MKTVNTFALSKLTDSDISRLAAECVMELERREEARRARRKTWVRDYHSAFQRHPNATYKVLGETVVVSVYDRCTGIHMSATTPTGNDKFELSTGIAVAFAKAIGERIPEYI
jgi:hypothetical protein